MLTFVAVVVLALFLFFGCTGETSSSVISARAPGQNSHFSLPQSAVSYVATYTVVDGDSQLTKKVFRANDKIRIDVSAPNANSFSLFFLGSSAYSCYNAGGTITCYDISSVLSQTQIDALLPAPDLSGAKEAESVDIGQTTGKCYFVPQDIARKRKMCLTSDGILAYDSYNDTQTTTHVEYLTSLTYSVDDSNFLLPSSPQAIPQIT